VVLSVCVLAALAAPAAAQEPLALSLTLDDAQARAVQASHRLPEAQAREAAARAVIDARQAARRPAVSAQAGYTRTNHVLEFTVPTPGGAPRVLYPDVPDNYRTRLDLQWPIYTAGRLDALERAARAEAAAVASEVAVARADLRLEVARAYWAVVTARSSVAVLEQGVARAQAHVNDVRERFNAGLVPPNEIASAEAQESRARMLLIEARNQRDVSSADLARLVGADLDQPIEPASSLEADAAAEAQLASLLADARASRAERVALERRIDAAEQQRSAAASGRFPTIAVAAGVDYARPNPRIFPRADAWDDSWDVGINLSWAFWDAGRTSADVAQASSLAEAARRRLAEFDSVLAVEVRQRLLEIASGRAAVAAAADAVRAATEARRVVNERYQAGVATQTEVLDADLLLLQAELDRTRAQANVRLAEARLGRAVGR
jgi:outer membrane protein TolC